MKIPPYLVTPVAIPARFSDGSIDLSEQLLQLDYHSVLNIEHDPELVARLILEVLECDAPRKCSLGHFIHEQTAQDWLIQLLGEEHSEFSWKRFIDGLPLRRFEVHWSKMYCASGTVSTHAKFASEARRKVSDELGDYCGSLQYLPDHNQVDAILT